MNDMTDIDTEPTDINLDEALDMIDFPTEKLEKLFAILGNNETKAFAAGVITGAALIVAGIKTAAELLQNQ